MVVKVLHGVFVAEERLDVVEFDVDLDARVEDAVGVEDLFDLLEEDVDFGAVEFFQVGRAQAAVTVFAAGAATHAYDHAVVIVDDAKNFLAVTDLGEVEEGLHVQVGVAGVAPDGNL